MTIHRSQFDPLDMALGLLARTDEPNPASRIAETADRHEPQPAPTVPTTKVQVNIRISATTKASLHRAAIELMRTHTLGDIIDELVATYLESAVRHLTTSDAPERLPSGRRVQRP
jgi:hypothetical protein